MSPSDPKHRQDLAASQVIQEIFRRLEEGATFTEIADSLNDHTTPMDPEAADD
jgi:hypothetical protein